MHLNICFLYEHDILLQQTNLQKLQGKYFKSISCAIMETTENLFAAG
jgi:hypothetical protein